MKDYCIAARSFASCFAHVTKNGNEAFKEKEKNGRL
jgi:hypothetical protein